MNVTPSATLSSLRGCGNQSRFPMTGKRQKSQMCSWRKPRRRSLLEEVRPSALQANTSHLSVPVKVIENISRHTRDHRVIWISQHGFSEGRSCLTYLVFFYEQMIGSGDNGRRDVKFVKVLDTVSQSTLTAKLVGRWLYKWTVVRRLSFGWTFGFKDLLWAAWNPGGIQVMEQWCPSVQCLYPWPKW